MLILGIDFETSGLNTEKDHIIQVGAVLWDTASPKKKAKAKIDLLLKSELIQGIDPGASEINGITMEDLNRYGQPAKDCLTAVNNLLNEAEVALAHNGTLFDKPMFESNCKRYGLNALPKLWMDSSCDINYPPEITTRKLVHLAAEHGFVNPFPHDAISDVLTMLKIFSCYKSDEVLTWAKSPSMTVRAQVTYDQRDLAKKQSYRWNNENKTWVKSVKEFQLDATVKAGKEAGFNVLVVR